MEGSLGIELRGLWSDMVVRALGCCPSLRIVVAENPTFRESGFLSEARTRRLHHVDRVTFSEIMKPQRRRPHVQCAEDSGDPRLSE